MEKIARPISSHAPVHLGARLIEGGVDVAVFSRHGEKVWFCLFDEAGEREIARFLLNGHAGDMHHGFVPGVGAGARYGLRADGQWAPERSHRFDPAKLLVDPYATRIDRPFRHARELTLPRPNAVDTAPFMPRAIIEAPIDLFESAPEVSRAPMFIYEVAVRAFTQNCPEVPRQARGTMAGLRHPGRIDHLVRLGVTHVELMPIAAWMEERHLPSLGLSNAWGYNPAAFMAPDPRLAPQGIDDLRLTVAALHQAGICVLLDVVFNHTAESDAHGATLSLRGLDNAVYYRHDAHDSSSLINDTGCGNTLACDEPIVTRLATDTLRYFVEQARVDGFRFDLAATLGRTATDFSADAPLLKAIAREPALAGCTLIAEPWDVGPGGYQLGQFHAPWREWNDRYRDDVRRFWRGDPGGIGPLATRLAGSADIFDKRARRPSAGINFIAAHDGFTLRDLVSHARKHNDANGENNRDGADDNSSWNCGLEGETNDLTTISRRARDIRALLATLFVSRGTPMLTAGDELGRTQGGNNNAYAQDNETTWLDWAKADTQLARFIAGLVGLRARLACLNEDRFLDGKSVASGELADVAWLTPQGRPFEAADWRDADCLGVTLARAASPGARESLERVHILFNRAQEAQDIVLPDARSGYEWACVLDSARGFVTRGDRDAIIGAAMSRRCVMAFLERKARVPG